jgi:pimeloyl-ACP methyl ester carboxylesterase
MTELQHLPVVSFGLSVQFRGGNEGLYNSGDTIILVPGLGCSKEWFNSAFRSESLRHVALVSFDFPNQGDYAPATIPRPLWNGNLGMLHQWVAAVYDLVAGTGTRFHIVAHSMGNLPALTAWRTIPTEARGAFIAIEGNLSTADCFASSRMSVGLPETEAFIDEMRASADPALKRWGDDLMWCDPEYLLTLARDLVSACGTDEFGERWEMLGRPHYLYGEDSGYPEHHRNLFDRTGTTVREIPGAGHFPMYTNATATWDAVADAVRSARG